MVICLERDADLHMAQLMPLPLTVSCFSKIQIGFTGQRAVKRVCACVLHSNYWIQYSVIYEPIEFRSCYFESASC